MRIASNIIDTIKAKADIVEVIGEYVHLTKKGQNYIGLCPFHNDSTPSLTVSSAKGIYKCFACDASGDVIKFLQEHLKISFVEAVKILANKYGIEIPENSCSMADDADQRKRESMLIINDYAAKFFAETLFKDTEESRKALDYAASRWQIEYIRSFGIGYASNSWDTFSLWAKAKGLDKDLLLELGLVKKKSMSDDVYDTFRGHIMIPIRDKQHRIVAFTARILPDILAQDPNAPKYINSSTSLIYDKGNSLFGIDVAWNAASKAGVMNLIEGAPDVMRLQVIGASNTVAPLGSSWTETIQEIPVSDWKNDPDSYLVSKDKLDELAIHDFVMWYASKVINPKGENIQQLAKAIHEVVELVKAIPDKVLQESYTDKLIRVYGHEDMWKREIMGIQSMPAPVVSSAISDEEYAALFKGTEIKVGNNCYYGYTKEGEKEISNFIMIPLYLIRDGASASRVFILRNVMGFEVRIEFSIEEMTVLQKFRNRIEREVNFMWYGTSAKFNKLRGILYSSMEVITKISTLGWQKIGFFAFGNGIILNGEWHPVNEEGIVRLGSPLGSFYLPAFSKMNEENSEKFLFEQKFIHLPESKVRFFQFATQMRLVYGDNAIIGICFIVVCLFRDIIIRHRREFPTLFLFGPKGTGKTAFGELLQSVFVYNGDHPNLRTSTMPSLATVLSQAEDAIMHLDEYKNDIDVEKIELLKGLWDCQGRSKLDIETRKREQSKVLSGVIVSGQEKPTVDIALYSRQCVLPFHKDTHTTEEKENFRVLKDWEYEGTSYIVLELLQVRTQFEQFYKDSYEQTVKNICTSLTFCIDERILHNWSVVLASYMAVQHHIQFPFTYDEVFKTVLNDVEYQNEECLHSNELSIFWKTVDYLKHDNQIYSLCDYRIHEYTSLKVDIKMDGRRQTVTREYGNAKKILMIPTNSRLFALYALHLQKTREKVIPENTLKYYLENSPEYIGKVNSVRFASVENVKDWPRQFEAKCFQCQPRLSEKPVQAFCLDFEAVEAAYGISLYSDYMAFDLVHNS
ncbi:MAG: DNA primase [Segatella salivae]